MTKSAGSEAPALRFSGVSFGYPESARPAVESIDLSVAPGEMVALVGGNGSGKSTLARLANGLLIPDEGRVEAAGIPTDDARRIWQVRSRVGLLFQNPDDQIVGATVADDVAFALENLGVPRDEMLTRVAEVLEDLDLEGVADVEPHLLSGGQRQRVALAGVLILRPAVLVLDEPTSSLDTRGRREAGALIDRVRRGGVGVLLITQHMDEALNADRLCALDGGRMVYEGSPADFFRRRRYVDLPLLPPPALGLWDEIVTSLGEGDESSPVPLNEDELVAALSAGVHAGREFGPLQGPEGARADGEA